MSKKKFILMNIVLLVFLWAGLFGIFTFMSGKQPIVYMVAAGVLGGAYGVAQKILRDKYKGE